MSAVAVDAREMARRLDIAPKTVLAMARRGDIPAFKAGRHWRFLPDAVFARLTAPTDTWAQPARAMRRRAA